MNDERIIAARNPIDSSIDKIKQAAVKAAQTELDKLVDEAYKAHQIFENARYAVDKAIEKLELMREYCNNVIHPSCDYNIYTDMIDFIDSTINSLEK